MGARFALWDLRRAAACEGGDAVCGDGVWGREPEVRRQPDCVFAGVELREVGSGGYVVSVPDLLSPEVVQGFGQALLDIVDGEPRFLILDVSGVADIEPGGVRLLVAVAERAGQSDVGLCLVVDNGTVCERLAASDVLDLFETAPTVDQAARLLS